MLKYETIAELVESAEKQGLRIGEVVLKDQALAMEISELEIYEKMELDFQVMISSVHAGQQKDQRSMSGLTGGEGFRMKNYAASGGGLCGPFRRNGRQTVLRRTGTSRPGRDREHTPTPLS